MPNFQFVIQRAGVTLDELGLDVANSDQAWGEATKMLGELITELDGELRQGGDLKLLVASGGSPVFTLRFSSTVHTGESSP